MKSPPSGTATSFEAPAIPTFPTYSKSRTSLRTCALDATTLAAALLHDVIEDTEFPVSRLEERFGVEVAQLVEGVTKISRLNMMAPEARQAENVRKMLLAMVQDVRVVMVKLADRLHNMRTLEFLEPPKSSIALRAKQWTSMPPSPTAWEWP